MSAQTTSNNIISFAEVVQSSAVSTSSHTTVRQSSPNLDTAGVTLCWHQWGPVFLTGSLLCLPSSRSICGADEIFCSSHSLSSPPAFSGPVSRSGSRRTRPKWAWSRQACIYSKSSTRPAKDQCRSRIRLKRSQSMFVTWACPGPQLQRMSRQFQLPNIDAFV